MIVSDGQRGVDVAHKTCLTASCYQLGFDKGTFVQGRGYTNYHKKEKPVCWTRHMNGCPIRGRCKQCGSIVAEPLMKAKQCPHCDEGEIEEVEG